ncbi:MAG: hypothetical protein AAGF12_14190 [Myxococcota bacterium]
MRGVLAFLLGVTGCADTAADLEAEPIAVLDPLALLPMEAERDPLAHHRPAVVDCPRAAWGPEGGGFEIQTGACNYAAFDQPLPVRVEAGDAFEILIWHDLLDAAEPATAHLGVWIGSQELWGTAVDIPAPSGTFEVVVPVDTTPPPDARLSLHLHNHGFNSWRFVAINLYPR